MEKSRNKTLPIRLGAPALILALFLHFFPTIPIIKYMIHLTSPEVEICQLSEDCTCPAATCQCDHGNDVFFSRYTDIQNGSASLSNTTKVIDISGITYTTCPSHQHHIDAEMASIGRFILVEKPQVRYQPRLQEILLESDQKPEKISPPEIFHPPQS